MVLPSAAPAACRSRPAVGYARAIFVGIVLFVATTCSALPVQPAATPAGAAGALQPTAAQPAEAQIPAQPAAQPAAEAQTSAQPAAQTAEAHEPTPHAAHSSARAAGSVARSLLAARHVSTVGADKATAGTTGTAEAITSGRPSVPSYGVHKSSAGPHPIGPNIKIGSGGPR